MFRSATLVLTLISPDIAGQNPKTADIDPLAVTPTATTAFGHTTVSGGPSCQKGGLSAYFPSDRALPNEPGWRDDWCATESGPVEQVSWTACFHDPFQLVDCDDPSRMPPDDFELRMFESAGALPGNQVGETTALIVQRRNRTFDGFPCWEYQAALQRSVVVQAGHCYWMEITGQGKGRTGCTVYMGNTGAGNGYAARCENGTCLPVDHSSGAAPDLELCIDRGLLVPDTPTSACCFVDGSCIDLTYSDCELMLGFWEPADLCGAAICPSPCEADVCEKAVALNQPDSTGGNTCDQGLPCARLVTNLLCDPTVGAVPCVLNPEGTMVRAWLGADVWFHYRTGSDECGEISAALCDSVPVQAPHAHADSHGESLNAWDSILAVYNDDLNPGMCPSDLSQPIACGDDTCGVPAGPAVVTFEAEANSDYFLRIGGWNGEVGTATLVLTLKGAGPCTGKAIPPPPVAYDVFDVTGSMRSCRNDDDCQQGLPGTSPQSVCRPGPAGDGCYVPRQRYLALHLPDQVEPMALRVSLVTAMGGTVPLGFATPPKLVKSMGPGPNEFLVSRIGRRPYYEMWTDVNPNGLRIADCAVSPGHAYAIQTIAAGEDPLDEGRYSIPLLLPTVELFGDVTGGGAVGSPPDGSSNLVDVFAVVLGFQNVQHEPKDWLDLEPNTGQAVPNLLVSLADAFSAVQAFQQNPYPGPAPTDCP